MFKYVDLCVELKKGRYAKDGLIHYRNVCQKVNVASLDEVIKYFIKTSTDRAEAAMASAEVRTLFLSISSAPRALSIRKRCSKEWPVGWGGEGWVGKKMQEETDATK